MKASDELTMLIYFMLTRVLGFETACIWSHQPNLTPFTAWALNKDAVCVMDSLHPVSGYWSEVCIFFWRAVIRSSSRPQGPRGGSLWWRLWGDTAVIWQPPQASLLVRTPLIFLKNHSTFMTSRWVTLLTLLTSAHSRRINAVFL